jgi:hypothetical protein
VIYVVLFIVLAGFDSIFGEIHGTSEGSPVSASSVSLFGLFSALVRVPIFYRWAKRDVGKIEENGGSRLPPESRLCSCGWWRKLDGTDYLGVGMKKKTRWETLRRRGDKSQR